MPETESVKEFVKNVESLSNNEPDMALRQAAQRCLAEFIPDEDFDAIMAVFIREALDLQIYLENGYGLTPVQVSKLCLYLLKMGPREEVMSASFITVSEPNNAISWYLAQKAVFHKIATEVGIPVHQVEILIHTYVEPFAKWYDSSLSGLFRATQLASKPVKDSSNEPGKAIRLLRRAEEKRSAIKKLFHCEMALGLAEGKSVYSQLYMESEKAEQDLYKHTIETLAKSIDQAQIQGQGASNR